MYVGVESLDPGGSKWLALFVLQVKPLRQTCLCVCHESAQRRWGQRPMVGNSPVWGRGICRKLRCPGSGLLSSRKTKLVFFGLAGF